ncbi:hypothetical protein KAI46_13325 [bacterium]|nr:hypothetical protein [bacterium]
MFFNIRRYMYALTQYWHWLIIALIPLAAYLLISGVRADRFTLSRTFNVNPEYPVAVTTSPVDTISLKSLAATPGHFFTDRLALASWKRYAETSPNLAKYNFKNKQTMLEAIKALSLSFDQKNNLRISYHGPDTELGTQLTNYYTTRLLSRLRAGFHRQLIRLKDNKEYSPPQLLQLDKTRFHKSEHNSWWRDERVGPATLITLLPLLISLIFIGFKEFTDPSFKSGRQAARYLNLPILGFFPSLEPIIDNLQDGNSD